MSTLWIILNLLDFQSFLILIFADVQFENNTSTTSIKEFGWVIVIMNLIVIAQFFETVYTKIFINLLVVEFIKNSFLGSISIYFKTIKINN